MGKRTGSDGGGTPRGLEGALVICPSERISSPLDLALSGSKPIMTSVCAFPRPLRSVKHSDFPVRCAVPFWRVSVNDLAHLAPLANNSDVIPFVTVAS